MTTTKKELSLPGGAGFSLSSGSLMPSAWLFIRLVLGIEWLRAGWEKVGDAGWTAAPAGAAVEGFLRGAIAKSTDGDHPEVQNWFADLAADVFIPNAEILAYLVAYGEVLVGLALIAGFLTRVSILFGVALNLTFLLAGTTSSNPQMLVLGLALAALGSSAGVYGLDRWVLPWLQDKADTAIARGAVILTIIAAALVAGWFSWTVTDDITWLLAALIAVLALAALGVRKTGKTTENRR